MSEDQKIEDRDKVVIVNGERASGLMTETAANAEAERLKKKIQENKNSGSPVVEVKTNICG